RSPASLSPHAFCCRRAWKGAMRQCLATTKALRSWLKRQRRRSRRRRSRLAERRRHQCARESRARRRRNKKLELRRGGEPDPPLAAVARSVPTRPKTVSECLVAAEAEKTVCFSQAGLECNSDKH